MVACVKINENMEYITMKKFIISTAVAGVVFAVSSAHAACDKMEPVVAAWLPIMQTTAYYVALEEKLFEKNCIKIDSQKMQSPNHIIDALVAGRADFGPPGAAAGIAMIAEDKFPGTFKVFGLQGGGIKIDEDQITDINHTIDNTYNEKILKIGKKKYFKIIVN